MYHRNVGPSDAALRWILGVVLVGLATIAAAGQLPAVHPQGMTLAVASLAVGLVLLATALFHYDLIYRVLKWDSTKGDR
jgi:membrane protein YdbS with pleckstrin-like domain